MINNSKNLAHLQSLKANKEKAAFMAGGKVTVGRLSTVRNKKIIHYYLPRIRGIFIGGTNLTKHKTPKEARAEGIEIMEFWKEEAKEDYRK